MLSVCIACVTISGTMAPRSTCIRPRSASVEWTVRPTTVRPSDRPFRSTVHDLSVPTRPVGPHGIFDRSTGRSDRRIGPTWRSTDRPTESVTDRPTVGRPVESTDRPSDPTVDRCGRSSVVIDRFDRSTDRCGRSVRSIRRIGRSTDRPIDRRRSIQSRSVGRSISRSVGRSIRIDRSVGPFFRFFHGPARRPLHDRPSDLIDRSTELRSSASVLSVRRSGRSVGLSHSHVGPSGRIDRSIGRSIELHWFIDRSVCRFDRI